MLSKIPEICVYFEMFRCPGMRMAHLMMSCDSGLFMSDVADGLNIAIASNLCPMQNGKQINE